MGGWSGAVVGIVSIIVMIIRWVVRMKSERRRLADEAGKMLDNAQKTKDKSGRLDAWMRSKWMRGR